MSLLPTRPLGKTGLTVSRLGLAAMSIRATRSAASGLTADDVERAFHEHGVTTFLVHPMMKAVCEGVRRLVAAGHRDELVLVSESSLPFAWSMRRSIDRHLRVLGTDRLDVWLVGWVRARWHVREGVWGWLRAQRDAGKLRAIGFSCHDRPLATALAKELPADVVMIRYNAAHRGAEREVFAPLAALGADRPGVIAYTATRWGLLLAPLPKQGFPAGLSGPECYRFALGHPVVDFAWCGARSREELAADVAGVLEGPLTPDRVEAARRFGDAVHASARGGLKWMFGRSAS